MKKRALIGFLTTQMAMLSNGITALASSEEYGLTDLMRDQSGKTADTQAMQIGTSFISDVFGYIITVGVYGLIAGQFIMTACDLLFITTPFIRKLLVSEKSVGRGRLGNDGANLVGYSANQIDRVTVNQQTGTKKEGSFWENRCFVSNDLQSLIRSRGIVDLKTYFKKRTFSIILVVVFIMMVIASNIFIDTGMNVGRGILKVLGLA